MDINSQKKILLEIIEEGYCLLEKYNVKWNKILRRMSDDLIKINTAKDFLDFLEQNAPNLYQGMGSLYDLFICTENGNVADDFKKANNDLNVYREKISRVWKEAKKNMVAAN